MTNALHWMGVAEAVSQRASANYVLGTNSMPPSNWANILYDYFIKNYQGTNPWRTRYDDEKEKTEFVFNQQNKALGSGKEAYHVHVMRGPIAEDRKHGAARTDCDEMYMFMIYVKDKNISELFPQIENISNEIRRIFIREYISYDIAGIREINHFRSTGLAPPNTGMNPNESHWLLPVSIRIFYSTNSTFNATPEDMTFNGARYYAGQWRAEADGRWTP